MRIYSCMWYPPWMVKSSCYVVFNSLCMSFGACWCYIWIPLYVTECIILYVFCFKLMQSMFVGLFVLYFYVHIHIHVCTHIYIYTHACAYILICSWLNVCLHVSMHSYIHTYIYIYIYIYIYTYICLYDLLILETWVPPVLVYVLRWKMLDDFNIFVWFMENAESTISPQLTLIWTFQVCFMPPFHIVHQDMYMLLCFLFMCFYKKICMILMCLNLFYIHNTHLYMHAHYIRVTVTISAYTVSFVWVCYSVCE